MAMAIRRAAGSRRRRANLARCLAVFPDLLLARALAFLPGALCTSPHVAARGGASLGQGTPWRLRVQGDLEAGARRCTASGHAGDEEEQHMHCGGRALGSALLHTRRKRGGLLGERGPKGCHP
eukprot:scaffold74295_cov43-Phaeocystis_antarctica.AAC.3